MSVHKIEMRFLSDYILREAKRKLKLKVIGAVILFIFLLIVKSLSNGAFPPTFVFIIGTVYLIVKLGKAFIKIGKEAKSTIFLVQEDKVSKLVFNKEINFKVNSFADLSEYSNSILYHQTFLTDNILHTTIDDAKGIFVKSEKSYTLEHDGEIYIPREVNDYKGLKAKFLKRKAVYKVSSLVDSPNYRPPAYTPNAIETVPVKKESIVKEPIQNKVPYKEPLKYKKEIREVSKREETPKKEPLFKKPEIKPETEKKYTDFKHRYRTKDRKYH